MKSLLSRKNRTTLSFTVNSRAITHKISDLGESKGKGRLDIGQFEPKVSLIAKQWHVVMPSVIMGYILIQCLISTQSHPYCESSSPYAEYTYQVAIAFVSCYAMACLSFVVSAVYVHTFTEMESAHLRGIYMGAATILLVAGCATGLYLTKAGNYACQDANGLYSPTSQWAEWLIAAPLLSFLTISIEEKPRNLTITDIISIFSMFMCILFGFMMNFTSNNTSGIVLYILSAICMLSNVFLARYSNGKHQSFAHKVVDDSEQIPLWEQERATMKNKLAKWLILGYPAFPILYLLNYFGILSTDGLVVGYMTAGFVLKFVFVSAISLEATMLQMAAERRLNESRRQLINYIFHEIRVPLNTITMGISVLKSDRALNRRSDKGVIDMMEGSADAVTNALNDVLCMSKTEEGAMRLELRLISVRTLVEASIQAVQEQADRKNVSIVVVGLPEATPVGQTPALHPNHDESQYIIRGDAMRLKHVLVHFLSNAIQQSVHPSRPQDAPPIVKIKICLSLLGNPPSYPISGLACGDDDGVPLPMPGVTHNSSSPWSCLNPSSLSTVQEIHTTVQVLPHVSILVSDNYHRHKGRERCVDEQLGLVVSNQIIKLHGGELVIKPKDHTQESVFGILLPLLTDPNESSLPSSSHSIDQTSRPSRTMMTSSVQSVKSSVDRLKRGYLTATGSMDYATSMGLFEDDIPSLPMSSTQIPRSPLKMLATTFPSSPAITTLPTAMIQHWPPPLQQSWPPTTITDSYMQRNSLAQGSGDYPYGIQRSRKGTFPYPVNSLNLLGVTTGGIINNNFAAKGGNKRFRHVASMLSHAEAESEGDEDDDDEVEKEDAVIIAAVAAATA